MGLNEKFWILQRKKKGHCMRKDKHGQNEEAKSNEEIGNSK